MKPGCMKRMLKYKKPHICDDVLEKKKMNTFTVFLQLYLQTSKKKSSFGQIQFTQALYCYNCDIMFKKMI